MNPMPEKSEAAKREEKILAFWEREHVFEKSLAKKSPKGEFIFYEGPPTANGKPGIHHLEARAFKDAIPRYKTMRGYRVNRRAGWDTHGLPVELQVEKELGFSGKPDIEKYGIAAFNKKCRDSVFTYIDLWAKFTKRMGYWVDETKAYFTFDSAYMEVLWNLFAKTANDGRLYKDYKVVPWCPRCGTVLSSHELAQGYQDVKDIAVTAKFELVDEPGTFFLAWTTTPWTLPGNVALAIGKNIAYGKYERGGIKVILADSRAAEILGNEWKRVASIPAGSFIGKKYKPLYSFAKNLAPESEKSKFNKAFQVYAADFVTTEEGTGIVHTAVMYGQEDFELGNKIGLPKVHLVNPEGKFVAGTDFLAGRSVVEEETTIEISKNLAEQGLLFSKEKYEHTYPFCWRCKTRLIYYARDSWYIRMLDLREKLVAENKKIHWEPNYIRDGRMGEWLASAKDWAISRERYWGTPLPIWRNIDGSEQLVIGSIDELKKYTKKSGNKYFVMRHGEATHAIERKMGMVNTANLTERGREKVHTIAQRLKERKITRLIVSPALRTRETARIIAEALHIPTERVRIDERVREFSFGDFEEKSWDEYLAYKKLHLTSYDARVPGGETYQEAKNRFGEALYSFEQDYHNENILIISHGIAFETLVSVTEGADAKRSQYLARQEDPSMGEMRELPFIPLPHNEDYELDLHRPYIDDIVLVSENGTELRRVPEVMDVWFDSGAMPFAQAAKERGNESLETFLKKIKYPADFICEAIDQTRGWFYTLLAIGTLAGRGTAFKNAISLGLLLDAEGQKMSKSKGNIVDPWVEIEKWGADTIRFWVYSVTQAGDSKNYDEKTVKEAAKVLSWIENSAKFYELFKDGKRENKNEQVIDQWMKMRTEMAIKAATDAMEDYQPYVATLAVALLAKDLSQWYVRSIRDRVRDGDTAALGMLRNTLRTSSLLFAPFAPFLAEEIFKNVKNQDDPESVHLAPWPSLPWWWKLGTRKRKKLWNDMNKIRIWASVGLNKRQEENIKVRQPLTSLTISEQFSPELQSLLADEVNVKKIIVGKEFILDTTLTPELIKEGDEREMARAVAEARKTEGYRQDDTIEIARGEGPHSVELSTGTMLFKLIRH
jgi:isoleucyl-tRNA synthetase